MYRTHNLGELNIKNVGEEVELSGWIQKIRNLGGMIFIDLRDQFGITQIVISDNEEIQKQAEEPLEIENVIIYTDDYGGIKEWAILGVSNNVFENPRINIKNIYDILKILSFTY